MKIDKPGEYVMRGGNRCTIKIVDWPVGRPIFGYIHGAEEFPRQWNDDGTMSALHEKSEFDIVDVYRMMVEREGWCNIVRSAYHKDHRCVTSLAIHSTEAGAINGGKSSCKEIIATAHITWKEPAE